MNNNNITNFTQNSLCLNEKNKFKNHMIPSKLDLGDDNVDCSFFCHLYLQLVLERPLKIRFNPRCRQNLVSLERISANKDLITYFNENDTINFIDFNVTMCKPYYYYSCNYSENYSLLTTVAAKSTILSINRTKLAIISDNQSNDSFNLLHVKVFYFMLVFTIIVFVTSKIFIHFLKPKK